MDNESNIKENIVNIEIISVKPITKLGLICATYYRAYTVDYYIKSDYRPVLYDWIDLEYYAVFDDDKLKERIAERAKQKIKEYDDGCKMMNDFEYFKGMSFDI